MSVLDQQISAQAERRANELAVILGDTRLTYGELEETGNRIGRALSRAGVRRGDRVCILAPKSPRTIAAIVGVLKCGAIYVPLDPDSPPARVGSMIASCDTKWLLVSHKVADAAIRLFEQNEFAATHVVGWLDNGTSPPVSTAFSWSDVEREEGHPVSTEAPSTHPAYIMFTSGSTGIPKGVIITHDNVASFLAWALPYFGFVPGDRISGHPPLHFDLSVFDIFGGLSAGAELYLVPPELNLLPARIVRLLSEAGLQQWFSVPAVFNLIAKFDLLADQKLPSLKRVLWCGEVLPTSTLRYWMHHVPNARFTNLYGPTEATIASSYYTLPTIPPSNTESIPIGTACGGEELLVLDDNKCPAELETVGDLYIAGAGLSPGYWRDPEKTSTAFITHPNVANGSKRIYRTGDLARVGRDGLVYFIGRADTQIKSRGYRIELGEIEAALTADQLLKEGAVVAIPSAGFDGMAICCAFVPLHDSTSANEVRSRLNERVPSYMLPSRWLQLDVLPRNANGKVDRRALESQFQSAQPR